MMNTARYSPNPMKTIIFNDMKRFWIVALAEFIILFLLTCSVILTNYGNLTNIVSYLSTLFSMGNVSVIITVMAFAVIAPLSCFRYLHNVSSVTAYHSLPVTRNAHFTGHLISSLILSALPVIVNSIILAVIKKPTYQLVYHGETAVRTDVYTFENIAVFTGLLLIVILFTLSVSILAGMLTCTGAMHAIGAVGLNIIAPATVGVIFLYASTFLHGFTTDDYVTDAFMHSTPAAAFRFFIADKGVGFMVIPVYIILSAVILGLALILYRRRSLERATDPLAFKIMVPVVSGILTFFISSFLGFCFEEAGYFAIGFIASNIVVYLLSRMLCLKTTRVFNKDTLKAFGIYAVIAAVILSFFVLDLAGYEKKTAQADNVSYVTVDALNGYPSGICLEDRDAIENAIEFHKELIAADTPISFAPSIFDAFYPDRSTIVFVNKDGTTLKRYYYMSNDILENSPAFKKLFESDSFKEAYSLYNEKVFGPSENMHVTAYPSITGEIISLSTKEQQQLIAAADKDFKARTVETQFMTGKGSTFGSIEIIYKNHYSSVYFSLTPYDKNCLEFLKSKGYTEFDPERYTIKEAVISDNDGRSHKIKALKGMKLSDYIESYPAGSQSSFSYYIDLVLSFEGKPSEEYFLNMSYPEGSFPEKFTQLLIN